MNTGGQLGIISEKAGSQTLPLDPLLELLIEAWPTLSKEVQQQIMLLGG